jgi:trimeric autotransporter adhesin
MNPSIQIKTATAPLLLSVLLACFGLVPNAPAQDMDGALPLGNNADGVGVLSRLTTGVWNSGFGFEALNQNTIGNLNTATGLRALFSNTEGHSNTANGVMALFSNTSGTGNVAIGAQALVFNADGLENTAVGMRALSSNTSGNANTAIGSHALFHNITSGGNTAIGSAALFSNTKGINNTATGSSALLFNDTGSGNTAYGGEALLVNTGSNNTATGYQALLNNTADGSTAYGYQAAFSNSTGERNIAIGYQALRDNMTADLNTAIGYQALANNTLGEGNTAIGDSALIQSEGNGNTALGDKAGFNLTTGDFNIYIANAGPASESNTIRIGRSDTVNDCYIHGIYGSTYGPADMAVRIGNDGKLGTMASSARFKKDIKPMDKASESILALKPVTFHYKNDAMGTAQFGLVAEEVAKVNPDLVVLDRDGKPYSVRYEQVNAMLLNEFLKEHRKVKNLEATVAELAARLERGSAQVQMNDSAAQVAANNH